MADSCLTSAYLLTENKNIERILFEILSANNFTHPENGDAFSSITKIKEYTSKTGNLSWLKKELVNIIQTKGNAFAFIIDLRLDSGIEADRSEIKFIRTLILSYILISRSEIYKDVTCNLFILATKSDYQKFCNEAREPSLLLNHIKTNEPKINDIIEQLKNNHDKFNNLFNISISDIDADGTAIKSELNVFINMLKAKEKLKLKLRQDQPKQQDLPSNITAIPADVVLRINNTYFVNGINISVYNTDISLKDGEIYIIGNFTSFTRLAVIERLLQILNKNIMKELNIKKDSALFINIPDKTVIDSTIPVSLAQLTSKELADFKNLKIKITMNNVKKIQQAKGFNMIQKYLIIT